MTAAAVDQATLLETAGAIAAEIVATAVWKDDRCSWVGGMPEEGAGGQMKMTFRALTADLYGGTAGVGLFLAEMAEATDDPDCRRTARAALRHAVSRSDDIPRGSRCGLYAGRPGIALALALAGRALDDPELDRAAREIVDGSLSSEPEGELDLMAGSAGAIVGLLTLSALLDDGEALISAATNHGDALLSSARHTATGLCWPSRSLPGEPGLTGWSHGAAGGAVALLELASATGEDRYRDAAEAAFAYERALFDPGARNWPDLRSAASANGSGQPTFATFWCHGAPGGALARLRALELGGGDELRQEARDALATTADWVEAALASGVNYSLCHGLAGNAEILLEGGSLLSAAPALGLRVAASGIATYPAQDVPWPSGAYGAPTPGLFMGLAGIGRYYLRLARPQVPSLLLVRPTPTIADSG